MTTDYKPSVTEMQRITGAMTPPPWKATTWYGSDEGGHAAVGPHHKSCDGDGCDHAPESSCSDVERADKDAAGIAVLHNAADALLEIAAAAQERQRAVDREDWDAITRANDRLRAALGKVRP